MAKICPSSLWVLLISPGRKHQKMVICVKTHLCLLSASASAAVLLGKETELLRRVVLYYEPMLKVPAVLELSHPRVTA